MQFKNKLKYFIGFASMLILLAACDPQVFYQKDSSVNPKGWAQNEKITFKVPVTDTLHVYDFYINIRNTEDYPYSNAFFLLKTTFPTGEFAKDTIECRLALADGRWTGKGTGKILDNRFLFKKRVIFPFSGEYVFEIEQGMRDSVLVGINDIGLRICNAK